MTEVWFKYQVKLHFWVLWSFQCCANYVKSDQIESRPLFMRNGSQLIVHDPQDNGPGFARELTGISETNDRDMTRKKTDWDLQASEFLFSPWDSWSEWVWGSFFFFSFIKTVYSFCTFTHAHKIQCCAIPPPCMTGGFLAMLKVL